MSANPPANSDDFVIRACAMSGSVEECINVNGHYDVLNSYASSLSGNNDSYTFDISSDSTVSIDVLDNDIGT